MAGSPAVAQPEAEIAIGGGYHRNLDVGDFFELPSTATLDARVTNWSGRWGVATRGVVGLGGVKRKYGFVERRHLIYLQVLVRHRSIGPGGTGLHLGVGAGLVGFQEFDGFQEFRVGFHLVALEALGSKRLTDRLSIRGGASLIIPFHVNPTVLLAWGF